ncbi:polymorphic toxin type 27 domain-containing protein, partial [Streptomyces sp. NPDC001941]|uniref:polymorphic toxin type 27 domain-containing protein n=1 Tax=Streptomyces sp. NPDC001941 TaxID=3154659 RepID=UPI0033207AEF
AGKATAAAAKATGYAYVTAQAAADAGKAAAQVAKPANDAIQIGSPYVTTDSAAGLVVLTGQASKTIAEQQQAVADAHAKNAQEEAAAAKSIADQAVGDAKAAYQHAANAAQYASEAKGYAKEALGYSAQAASAAAKATQSLARTVEYDRQATEDAAAADKAAGRAEGYAEQARASADAAALDAAAARAAADVAEQAARDARAAADRADTAATEAEQAAKDAEKYAKEAQEAADRAEKAGKGQQIETGTVPDGSGGSLGNMFYVVDHVEQVGEPQVTHKTEACDDFIDQLFYKGNCTITATIKGRQFLDLYYCGSRDLNLSQYTCPASATVYVGEFPTDVLSREVTHTITMAEYQSNVDPVDILFGSWIKCVQKIAPGGEEGSWGGCGWALFDVATLFAGKAIRPIADAVRAIDAAARTGIGFIDAWKALRTLRLSEAVIAGITAKIMTLAYEACEAAAAQSGPALRAKALAARAPNEECIRNILKDLAKNGDHVVLGINPGADTLRDALAGSKTFNGDPYGTTLPAAMGMGNRPIWTVGVEEAVGNPNVRISVSLDGVEGATRADQFNDALRLLLERGDTITAGDWAKITSRGFGTAWEMTKLRAAVRMGKRDWKSIDWYMDGKLVKPERFRLANGELVPEAW